MQARIQEFIDAITDATELTSAFKQWLKDWGNYMLLGGTRPPRKPPI